MPRIKPKISINKAHVTASKQFTDRTGFIETFWSSINNIHKNDTKVLVYYGIGGIGKTSLRKKLQSQIEEKNKNIIWSAIDFEVKQHRENDNALIYIRTELSKKYKIKFPLFDCAYTYYLKKTSPQIPLNNNSLQFLEEGDLVTDIITTFHDMPLIGIPTKIGMLLNKGFNKYTNWVTQKRINQIIDMAAMDSKELLEYLPAYFAEDLLNFLDKNNKKVIIFLDTYEALWEINKNKRMFFEVDDWIRNVLITSLPGVLFVILGREKLRWEEENPAWIECIDQHLVGKLAEEDAKHFLETCQIHDGEIINRIIELSDGHPYSLDLCVDTYYAIKKNRMPIKEDFNFDNNKTKIFERFMRYLELYERETLKVLSVPRFWDDKIFEILIKEYNIGYPVSALSELCYFSFISERTLKNTWEMHSLMKKSLHKYIGETQLRKIHKFIFNYYSNKLGELESKNDEQIVLNESYYHGKNCLNKEIFEKWFLDKSSYFIKIGNIFFLKDLYQESWQRLNNEKDLKEFPSLFSKLSYRLGQIYIDLGRYKKAEEVLKSAEELGDKNEKTNIISLLAILQKITYNYKESENYFIKTIKAFEELEKNNYNIKNSIRKIKCLIEYGKLKVYLSENDEAVNIYKKCIKEIDSLLERNEEIYTLLNCKAVALEKLGETNSVLSNYETSGNLYKEAIKVYEQIIDEYKLYLEEESNLIYLLNNKGMVYKRLAEYYVETNSFDDAILNYKNALEIYGKSLEKSLENVDTYRKIGFAARGLLRQLVKYNIDVEEIQRIFNKCLEAFKKALELSPKDVSVIHSMGGVYTIIAKMYEKESDFRKAIEFYDKSIKQSTKAIEIQPDYLYAYDGKAETLMYKGDINFKLGNLETTLRLYLEGLINIEEILKRAPKALYAKKKKEKLLRKIKDLQINKLST